ncbi:hypothetical protein SLEP1_g18770 [Rubroshorea leprosula]|uniref:RNase H type-1 domain-containing protein n=1 Tax=Rubroshorea leprosula TaxID=152421 RepID=A0AAV5JAG6_9ROSI|nr:hypothetical protein SLEP1_g18770 [Rubroshorea leprosula]
MGFRLLNSTPHYAQANGQAEASNKVVINLLEKMVDDNPRRWYELLSETLWAYRTSQRSSTKMTPFALTYGHDAVLPMELTAKSLRIAIQHNLQSREYDEAMMLELEDLEDTRLTALDRLQAQKLKIAKSYNNRTESAVKKLGMSAAIILEFSRFCTWPLESERTWRNSAENGGTVPKIMEKIMEEVTSIEGNKNREKRTVQGLPNTHTDCPEHVFQLLDCFFQILAIVSRFPRFSRLVHSLSLEAFEAMPPRKSRDKEVQPAQAEHANDPITFLPVSPLAKRSYGNPIFKERDADRRDDFAESSNVFRGMIERLDLAFKEQNQAMRRLVESQVESSRREEELIRQCIEEMRRVFEKGTKVMRETGEESHRPLQAVSEQVVEQVRQPRPEIFPPVQHFVIGEGQRQHQLMEAATLVADHGHQPQHKYILPTRKGNVGPHHQPCPRDFFQPQVPPAQPVQRGLQNQPAQFFNRDHGPTLRSLEKIAKGILKFPDRVKETMGVDTDPFPAVSVGVNVADLRSVARNRSLPYAQRNLAAEDLRWVLEAQRSRHSRSVRLDQQRLGGQERITVTRNFSPEGARRYSTGTRSPRMVKLPLRSPSKRWEKISHPKFPAQNPRTLRRRLQRKRAEERKRQQKQMEAKGSSSRRPRQPTKRNMVWVRKEKKEAVTQTLLKEDDQSPASPKVASVIVSPDGVLKATFEAQEQSGNRGAESKEDGTIHFGEFLVNLSCLVLTLPLVFQAKKEEEPIVCEFPEQTEEEVIVVPAQDDEKEDMADKIVFEKPEEKMTRHIRPLYINAHMDGTPISRVLVDNGAAVNVLPTCMLYKIGKSLDDLVHTEVTISDFTGGVNCSRGVLPVELTVGNRTLMSAFFVVDTVATYNALLRHDWIHSSWCVPSSLHQKLIFWNGGKAEVVSADDKPFSANTHLVEARYYEEDIGTIRFFGMDRHGKLIGITACSRLSLSKRVVEEEREKAVLEITKKLVAYFAKKVVQVDRSEIVHEGEEANRGSESEPNVTFISGSLEPQTRDQVVRLLHEFKDCFAWDYLEMLGLNRRLVEHKLPIAEGFRPYKQLPRCMSAEVTLKVKEEIERLVKAGFIRTCRYADWLSNVVPVLKKNGKLRVCVDFRNLNLATPKDEYPMPITDLLVDGVARHKILSFMDGHSGYNQIFIADADVPKTAFRCPGAVGTFKWVVMPFGLKNAGATYQRAMNAIFHDMIGKFMEIYIDDVVVKSHGEADHLVHLRKAFERMRQHGLKMNPLKCAFGVSAGNFLGYLVHERGLEIDKNKARAVIEAKPPQNKKELQRFFGQVNFLRRFISNLAGKTRVFSPLLKLKSEADFKWEEHHQFAFDMIKWYLSRPPVLVPPVKNKPLILYISAADESIGCLLAQENDKKQEQAVYYLSRCLTQTEVKYSSVEKLCLALFFAAIKLRHYLIYSEVYVIAKTDIVKYMLCRPLLRGRIGKWILALFEFNLKYIPQKAVKGQALVDFLVDHPCLDAEADEEKGINLFSISLVPWKLIFDGSSTKTMSGAGVVVISPSGLKTQMSFQLDFNCTNHQAEYEALIIGLEMLVELKVSMVEVIGDSQLVLRQLFGECKCTSLALALYFALAVQLLEEFDDVSIRHVPIDQNYEANEMAQIASGLQIPEGVMQKVVIVEKRSLPLIHQRGMTVSTCSIDITQTDWRFPIIQYLKDQSIKVSRKTKMQALNYVLIEDVLYRRGNDELLLRCLGPDESFQMLSDVHDGICGAHQTGIKMRWLIRRHGFFWPSVLKDCIAYAKGCKSCQAGLLT